jgi:rare lipoprotein A
LCVLLIGCAAKADNYSSDSNIFEPTQVPYVINNITYYPIPDAAGYAENGVASWYGADFHGRSTSNGERYDMYAMTAAHKTLPMNTMLLVKNMNNGKEIIVRVNDRGPFVQGRVIDLSYTAAQKLNIVKPGTSRVKLVALAEKSLFGRSPGGKSKLPDLYRGEFYVQIGAFNQKGNAVNLQKRFTDAGHTTVIQQYHEPQQTYYRVHVYAGKEFAAAKNAEAALVAHGYKGAFLVAR